MSNHDPRAQRILSRIRGIPKGQVRTYGDIDPRAPRLVGRVLHDTDEDVPWYRVVRSDGSLAKGNRQRELLLAEGVPMKGNRVDLRLARAGVPEFADPARSTPPSSP
jgi:alkylated DNA nucleotide flippase Atl1